MDIFNPFIQKYKNQIFEFNNSAEMYNYLYSFVYEKKHHTQYDFLSLFFYLLSSEKIKRKKTKESYVSDAMKIIDTNYCASVADTAMHLNVTPRYLSRIFKECVGKTIQEHILYKKVERAKTHLKNSNMTVRNIAFSLGYESEFAFSYAFKKQVGISPSQFRKSSFE